MIAQRISKHITSFQGDQFSLALRLFSRSAAGNFGRWYRNQFLMHPNWIGEVHKERQVKIFTGQHMYVSFAEEQGIQLTASGVWSPLLTNRIRSSLAAGDVFVDVGANIGYFTLLAASIVGDSGMVLAFEPCPENLVRITRHVMENGCGNVAVSAFALGDYQGIGNLATTPWYNSGLATLRNAGSDVHVKALVTTLDKLSESFDFLKRIRIAKIDVEGFEPQVLDGMRQLLASGAVENLVVEVTPEWFNVDELVSKMEGFGYRCEASNDDKWVPVDKKSKAFWQSEFWFSKSGVAGT